MNLVSSDAKASRGQIVYSIAAPYKGVIEVYECDAFCYEWRVVIDGCIVLDSFGSQYGNASVALFYGLEWSMKN